MLLHDAERPKREKTRFCTVQKGQKEKKHASARCRMAKKRKITLLHGAERLKREKRASARRRKAKKKKIRFCTMQKGQKEKKHASARRRKAKKSKNMLLHDAERSKREKTRFCTMQKGQKEELHRRKWLFERKKRGGDVLKRGFLKF